MILNDILKRLLIELGDMELIDKLLALPKSDLNSLLLDLFQKQAERMTPSDVVKSYQTNRFSVPSQLDPVSYHALETELLSIAQKAEIKAVLLSPCSPFGSSSAFGCVNQNKVVSAVRGVEIFPDPSNMLSIIIAEQLKSKKVDNAKPIHYCTTARVLRAQVFPNTGRHFAHFGQFCIVSSGKDSGSYACEKELLFKHLSCYKTILIEKYNANLSVVLRKRHGYTNGDGFFDEMAEIIKSNLPEVPLSLDNKQEDSNYYKGINCTIFMEKDSNKIEIGDVGFVDWIQKMTNNKKDRCLISGIGLDRLLL